MTDEATTPATGVDEATATTNDAAAPSTDKPTATKKTTSRSRATKTAGEQQKCAACGKSAVFTEVTTIGDGLTITYHGCAASQAMFHDFWSAYSSDQNTPIPSFAD